jgi:atypical dual specificity phosphatase
LGRSGVLLRKVRAAFSDEPTSFRWVEIGKLAASGYPASRAQILWLKSKGVKRILTLTEEPLPGAWLAGTGVKATHVPMEDHAPPAVSALEEAVREISDAQAAGDALLVHCLAGRGRTMTVIAAYEMKTKGLDVNQAIAYVRRLRGDAIEKGQEKALADYLPTLGERP